MQLCYLSNTSQVKFISSLSKASALMNVARSILGAHQSRLSGRGQTIAFIDTGICKHCDFCLGENRLIVFKDFLNGKSDCYDDNGHGTFVAGVCCGNGALSGGKYSGIAPQSKIISLKALDKNGEASADKILKAMEWVYDNHKEYNFKTVCMSFGSEPLGGNDPIMSGADALWDEGVTVVAAAGNSGPEYQTIKSPGVSSRIITVGGFNDNRFDDKVDEHFFEIADFSSRGPAFRRYKPDLVAPAVDITSCGNKKAYTCLSGTSVATPMIAGLCALMLEKEENLTPNEIKRRLLLSAKSICFNRNLEGLGYPNLERILRG
ncbi:MAG: S8 family peptidase [Clostridia bacterium]|nr:S8 family peptidase [Clostridia bacterium]